MISIIVACDPKGVIGKEGKLPWYNKEDLKLFKERTTGHAIVMGRITWDSLPKKPLPNRINVVITHNKDLLALDGVVPDGPWYYPSIEEGIQDLKAVGVKQIFIIGGEQIYKNALDKNLINEIILSRMKEHCEGDKFFPALGPNWKMSKMEKYEGFDVLHFRK